MKVELVKVKISKLREVKRQLRMKKNKNQKSLKTLLLGDEKEKRENNELYKSINALFQNDNTTNEITNSPTYSENILSDYQLDLEDLLESLETYQKDISTEEPSISFSEPENNINTEEIHINPTRKNWGTDSFSYMINDANEDSENNGDDIYLYNPVENESIVCSTDGTNLDTIEDRNDTKLEPAMMELGYYYIPDSEIKTIDEEMIIKQEDFCNEIELLTTEGKEINLMDKEVTSDDTDISSKKANNLVNPMAVNYSFVDIKGFAMNQLQKKKSDTSETEDSEEMELLSNYNEEQRENIISAAKLLYIKRTRTLLHWLDPKLPLSKLKSSLNLSWKNLPIWQKQVYINQVMGPLVVETVSPMLNPQLTPGGYETATPVVTSSSVFKKKNSIDYCIGRKEF